MITILHGDLIDNSRDEYIRLKAQAAGKEVRTVEGRGLQSQELITALESKSLYGGDCLVCLENVFSKLGKKTKLAQEFASILLQNKDTVDIVVWEDRELSPGTLKLFPGASVRLFKSPPVLFQLLDSIKPGSQKATLAYFETLSQSNPAEVTFVMITRRVRQLIQIAAGGAPPGLAPWQLTRLTAQARQFTIEKLTSMLKDLAHIDLVIKTGATPFSLQQHIEQFLISI